MTNKNNNNEEYWRKRDEEILDLMDEDLIPIIKSLKKAYQQAFADIKNEIKIYKFDNKKKYIESQANDMLKRIDAILKALSELEQTIDTDSLKTAYVTNKARIGEFLNQAGISPKNLTWNVPNVQAVENVIKEKFFAHNFSDRIWNNKERLSFTLQNTITEGLIKGESYSKMANKLNQQMGTGFYNCERLIRTETKRCVDKAKLDQYAECGIEEYKLITAHDGRVCEKCKAVDGKIFRIKDAKAGVNYTIHPNDRCCIIPIIKFD